MGMFSQELLVDSVLPRQQLRAVTVALTGNFRVSLRRSTVSFIWPARLGHVRGSESADPRRSEFERRIEYRNDSLTIAWGSSLRIDARNDGSFDRGLQNVSVTRVDWRGLGRTPGDKPSRDNSIFSRQQRPNSRAIIRLVFRAQTGSIPATSTNLCSQRSLAVAWNSLARRVHHFPHSNGLRARPAEAHVLQTQL